MELPSITSLDKQRLRAGWRMENGLDHLADFAVRGKPKLHGVSMTIRARSDAGGRSIVQSALRKGGDASGRALSGYGRIREEVEATLFAGRNMAWGELGIFGEWAGPGIQKKDAVTRIDRPRLFVFAAWFLNGGSALKIADQYRAGGGGIDVRHVWRNTDLLTCPDALSRIINPCEHVEIVPWVTDDLRTELLDDGEAERVAGMVNGYVDRCAVEDPYIRDRFGVAGPGEGLVMMPVSMAFRDATLNDFSELSWKAKTKAHSVKHVARPAVVKFEAPASIERLVCEFVTQARIDQIAGERFPGEQALKTRTGQFITALVEDVMKESAEERAALGADELMLLPALRDAAREAWLARCEAEMEMPAP
ncbi:hypothetical protein [Paracoccus sp. ME4]|uniref:hypothetical protein n=1 Tax=Paracoccus sp. ME4 TaxID=3138066 RepID=UPI00398B9A06